LYGSDDSGHCCCVNFYILLGGKNIKKLLAPLIVIILIMLTVSGVYAEDIDVDSSDVAQSPISADVDASLSSCDAFNNDLSNIYEPSDIDGEINPTMKIVDDNVILNDDSDSKNILENINIPVLAQNLNLHDGVCINGAITIISEVTSDIETSESYKLISDMAQADTLHEFDNDNARVAVSMFNIPNTIEPASDSILRGSEYISKVEEVYYGLLSNRDNKKLLNAAGSAKTLLFANMAYWHNGTVKLEMLRDMVNHNQSYEDLFDVNTVTKALLKYDSQEKEWWIYKFSEDEQSHVINDTNSHGLDYAYDKHVNVINKDMLKFVVLTPYGIVFVEEQSSVGPWDGLNDILDGISSKTLLPDHQAIWTPLLLLIQQDSKESDVDSHTDDNKNKDNKNNDNKKHDGDTIQSDSKDESRAGKHFYKKWDDYYLIPNLNGFNLDKLVNSTKDSNNNTNSTNATVGSNKKAIESPKLNQNSGPSYTLVYAIIGIVIVSIFFNSGYMKRDD